jgi:flagellar hook-basal body complex protein FliE
MQFTLNALPAASLAAPGTAVPGLPINGLAGPTASLAGQAGVPTPFADLMTDAVGQVSQLEDQARVAVDGLMTGSGVDVHQAMIAMQKASMAFELALAVRNKAVQAYQQVIGMQF